MSFSGLELARAIQSQDFVAQLPPWVEHMNVHEENLVQTVQEGRITSVWTPGKQFSVPDGYVQGGLCSAMADGSQALAILTTQKVIEVWVTQDLHIRFMRPIKVGTSVDIESVVVNKSATTAFVETTFCLPGGKLAAKVTGSWRSADSRRELVVARDEPS